jgi:hypothetical protein
VHQVDARNVAEGALRLAVLVAVDDERAAALHVAAVAHLAAAGAQLLGVDHARDVVERAHALEQRDGGGRLLQVGGPAHDERDLGHGVDLVAARHDERGHGRGGERRGDGVAALRHVDLAVPAAPDLGGREHAALAAHVTEGALAGAARAAAAHTRDTRHGAARAPAHGARLLAARVGHGVGLALVLAHVRVHERHDVVADRRQENACEGGGGGRRAQGRGVGGA